MTRQKKQKPKSFGNLYRKYQRAIFKYFWHRVGQSQETAEDLMQETFLRAFQSLKSFRNRGVSYYSYLKTIAHNLLVNFYRKPKEPTVDSEIKRNIEVNPAPMEEEAELKLEWTAVNTALNELSADQQKVVLLYYRDNLPVKEIAKKVGKTENAVKLHLSRARKKLADRVKKNRG